jgi:predicted lipoprotein with Yx(FWY)xxD motif
MKARLLAACSLGLIALVAVAGCGGSSNGSAATAATHNGSSGGSARGGTVDVADNPQLGRILVDAQGRTLYLFDKDMNGSSSCSGRCAKLWPPLMTKGGPSAGSGVTASMLGTTKRSDGTMQVTYGGHPLYTYAADTAAGQTTGNGVNDFGAPWFAVRASGSATSAGRSSSGGGSASAAGGTSSSGGGSYGY